MMLSHTLHGGTYNLYAAAVDKDYNYLIALNPRVLTVNVATGF
jgi:hypothetical protein